MSFSGLQKNKQQNIQAFHILFELFYQDAYRTAYLITKNPSSAEDAVQEAFVKAFSNLDTLKEPSKFGTWIKTITARCAIDTLREQKRLITVDEVMDIPANNFICSMTLPMPETEAERNEMKAKLLEVIDSMKTIYRQVIILKYYMDFDNQQISETLGIPLGTVKSRIYRALEILYSKIRSDKSFPLPVNYSNIKREGSL